MRPLDVLLLPCVRATGVLVVAALVAACPKVPHEAPLLSQELGGMIESARRAHLHAIELYTEQRRVRVEEYLEQVWIPAFLNEFVPASGIIDSLARAPTPATKGALMIEFATDGLREIAAVRDTMLAALGETERLLRRAIEAHYDDMRIANQALTAHLRSAAEVSEIREDLRERLGLDVEELVPLDAVNAYLERLTAAGGRVEGIGAKADSLRQRVRELLERKP